MKRHGLLRHLRYYGCILKREGAKHSLFQNLANGVIETIPRHIEIDNKLAEKFAKIWKFHFLKKLFVKGFIQLYVEFYPQYRD